MKKDKVASGTVHKMPSDLKMALISSTTALDTWQSLSRLSRNEWICWIISVKKAETRKSHIDRTINDLSRGKRRPCCWMGCIHRPDKPISPSVKWIIDQRSNSKSL